MTVEPPPAGPPTAALVARPADGIETLGVVFDASGSVDDSAIVSYAFDLDGDGHFERDNGTDPDVGRAFFAGTYPVGVLVTDDAGETDTATLTLVVEDDGRTWEVVPADAGGSRGLWNASALVDGHPAIAYYDNTQGTGGAVLFRRATDPQGSAWGEPLRLARGGNLFDRPRTPWIAFSADGAPAIAYADAAQLRFLRSVDTTGAPETWTEPLVLDALNSFYDADVSLLALPDGGFGISYYQSNTDDLYYAVDR